MKLKMTIKKHLTLIFGAFSLFITIVMALVLNFVVDDSFFKYADSKAKLEINAEVNSISDEISTNMTIASVKNKESENSKGFGFGKNGGRSYQLNSVEQELKDSINTRIIIIGLISFIISLLVGYLISRNLSKPLKSLTKMTQEIEQGNYEIRDEYKSSIEEITVLNKALIKMSDQISKSLEHDKRISQDVQHEIRTPLTNIKAQLEAMIDGIWQLDEKNIKLCLEEVNRLNDIVNQLYQLGNLENSLEIIKNSEIRLNEMVTSIIESFKIKLSEQRMDIQNLIDKNFVLRSDENLLYSALFNILSNSIRYSGEGTRVKIYLDVFYRNDNKSSYYEKIKNKGNLSKSYNIICVEDNGVGIESDKLDMIFERFYRVDKSRSRKIGGAGLGLSIVSAAIMKLKGFVDVESEKNIKTTFYLYLEDK